MPSSPPHSSAAGRWQAYCFLALSMSLVGTYVALSKPLVAALSVFLLAWLRFGIAAVAMLHWLRRPPFELAMSTNTRRLLFVESFVGNFLFSISMLFGVSMTSAVSAGVILATIPAVVAIMSRLFLNERVAPRVWGAIACGVFGIALLAVSKSQAGGPSAESAGTDGGGNRALWGNVLVFIAVLCEATYAVIGKKLTGVLSPKRISALINLWGFVLMTPLGVYAALHFNFSAVSLSSWLLLVFYALAASVWTVWLWMSGLKTVPAARAGVFSVMLPISAATVGVFVLGEPFSGMQGLAFAFALSGVLLATLPARTSAAASTTPTV